jgi:predicted RNA-binding protein YlxR (DUF448 family)
LARGNRADAEQGPERTCIVTRCKGSPEDMIRFVVGPGALIIPDLRRKLPGRGLWVTARADKVAEAIKRQAFSRAFKAKITASEHLVDEIETLLTQDCLQALSIANKAGQVINGFGKVEDAVAGGDIAGLIHAKDAGADGVRKLTQGLRRRLGRNGLADQSEAGIKSGREGELLPQIKLFESAQLDLALGRSNVIHAALVTGAASEAFLKRSFKLALYRTEAPKNNVQNEHVIEDIEENERGLAVPSMDVMD